jgi:hypothetical protein
VLSPLTVETKGIASCHAPYSNSSAEQH